MAQNRLYTHWKLWRLLLLCLLAITAIACTESNNDPAPTSTNNPSQVIHVTVGRVVALQANNATESGGASISSILYLDIQWSIVSGPPNSKATIENADSATPTFRPDIVGEYVLRVVITQNGEELVNHEITIVAGLNDIFPTKPATHIQTTDICEACHDPNTWALVAVDHNQVIGMCSSCHDGVTATGKGPNHIVTQDECDICHLTVAWISNGVIDHTGFAGNCITCHDGIQASGKSSAHIPTTDQCDACHYTSPSPWLPIAASAVDHTQVIGVCSSCHDNVTATGKGPTHVITQAECDSCHTTLAWITTGVIDHTGFAGNCISCHDGIQASGKSAAHIPTTDQCDACHAPAPAQWIPVAPSVVDHNQVIGTCVSCHNSVIATGKSATHIVSSDQCDACHAPAPSPWIPVPVAGVDHANIVGACVSCHNGVVASGKSPTHIASTDTCDACHAPGPTPWTPVAPAAIDHSQVIGTCASCHNGIIATGQSATHIPTPEACDVCHNTVGWLVSLVPVP